MLEKFGDTKEVIRSRKSKTDIQYSHQMREKKTKGKENNNLKV